MLKVGSKAPEFILPDESGKDTSLTDLLKSGPLILYFYPADFTPGCTKEACAIRDEDSHSRFRDKHDLPFTLLCDEDKTAAKMFDVDGPFGVGVRRATFLIAQDKTIQDAVMADVRIGRHEEFIRRAISLREAAGMKDIDRSRT